MPQATAHPQLTLPYTRGLDDPDEVIGMMNRRKVKLNEGYHKRAYVYVGELAVLLTFDTGSFRNAIRLSFLEELEAKQKAGQLGAQVESSRASFAKREIVGASTGWTGSHEEVGRYKDHFQRV